MNEPTDAELLAAAELAAPHWGLAPASIEIMARAENVVFDLTLPRGRHVALRLHRPGYNTLAELRSEVAWVASLAASGLRVSTPLPADDGEHYVAVQVGTAGERLAAVIEWVPGTPVGDPRGSVGPPPLRRYEQIGELAAAIRAHNQTWIPPTGFVRRRWDREGLVGEEPVWGRFWDVETLTARQRSLFTAARDRLRDTLSALSVGPERFGMIHADLHLANVMADGERLTVIDFDDSGLGWYSHELAVALNSVQLDPVYPEAKAAMIEGYRRRHEFTVEEERSIADFLVVRALMVVGWLAVRPEVPFYDRLPAIASSAESVTDRYMDGAIGGSA